MWKSSTQGRDTCIVATVSTHTDASSAESLALCSHFPVIALVTRAPHSSRPTRTTAEGNRELFHLLHPRRFCKLQFCEVAGVKLIFQIMLKLREVKKHTQVQTEAKINSNDN